MTHEEYAAIKAINWSSLKHLSVSPLMYKWRLAHPEPPKPAFVFGAAVHCAILEPEAFEDRYAVYDGIRRGKAWDDWQAANPDVESLKPDEMERVLLVAEAVRKHRVAAELLRGGRSEQVVTWTDEATGLACKGRFDYLRPDLLIDVKSTNDPRPARFEAAAMNYGYAGQVGFYQDGAERARLISGAQRPYIIAPQTDEPFDVAVFQLRPETLEVGRVLYRRLLRRLVECIDSDFWPGVAPDLQQLGLPPWAENQNFVDEGEVF